MSKRFSDRIRRWAENPFSVPCVEVRERIPAGKVGARKDSRTSEGIGLNGKYWRRYVQTFF